VSFGLAAIFAWNVHRERHSATNTNKCKAPANELAARGHRQTSRLPSDVHPNFAQALRDRKTRNVTMRNDHS
jgi:hypothetical protein